jgi:hypothetical protein
MDGRKLHGLIFVLQYGTLEVSTEARKFRYRQMCTANKSVRKSVVPENGYQNNTKVKDKNIELSLQNTVNTYKRVRCRGFHI